MLLLLFFYLSNVPYILWKQNGVLKNKVELVKGMEIGKWEKEERKEDKRVDWRRKAID